jgi:hypothetical protein
MMTIKDEFDIDKFFTYLNDLSEDEFDVPALYSTMIMSLLENLESKSMFKFKLPLQESDDPVFIHLKKKENIQKVLDYIIQHLYRFEIYEFIKEFLQLKEYYEDYEK